MCGDVFMLYNYYNLVNKDTLILNLGNKIIKYRLFYKTVLTINGIYNVYVILCEKNEETNTESEELIVYKLIKNKESFSIKIENDTEIINKVTKKFLDKLEKGTV